MNSYFARRILLVPLTLFGITLFVFMLLRLSPGGPVERDLQRMLASTDESSGGSSSSLEEEQLSLSPVEILELEEKHRRDKHPLRAYIEWLGFLPKDFNRFSVSIPQNSKEISFYLASLKKEVILKLSPKPHLIDIDNAEKILSWKVRLQTPEIIEKRWYKRTGNPIDKSIVDSRAVIYLPKFDGLLQGNLGYSEKYGDPVWNMILDRIPISLFYGGVSLFLIYSICIPLGVIKAIKHKTWIDNTSSFLIFAGYAIPNYVLGSLLLVYLGAQLDWFPLQGFVSENFADLSLFGKIFDLFHHGFMPLMCYLVGSFAFLTFMVKNNLMDNLSADYVRTAMAKGASYNRTVFKHALRNSLIPVAATFGESITIFIGGSLLIEKIFDINGFGLLNFNAILERDESLVLGILTVSAFLMLIGNILSDFCVALVDPRVKYKSK